MTDQPTAIIRSRRDDDLPALGRVLIEVHDRDGYPVEGVADPTAWLNSDHLIGAWVAELDGEPVGQVALSRPTASDDAVRLWVEQSGTDTNGAAVLGRLFVSSQARGHHVGQRLTTTAVQHAREIGLRAVLDVMAKDAAAIRTYEALGWKRLGSITHTFGDGQSEAAFAYVSPAETDRADPGEIS